MTTPLQLKIGTFKQDENSEVFPVKEGGRCKVDIEDFIIKTKLKAESIESIVLTLLKNDGDKNFSLSIKLNKNSKITSSELNEHIPGTNKYKYINIEDSITKLYNFQEKDVEYTHILIIGTAINDDNTSFTFNANKSIFVTTNNTELINADSTFQNLLTIEEFLNLRYIDYFSFDNEKFNELYKGISQGGGGISTKIKNKSK